MYTFGSLAYLLSISCFLYFLITGYKTYSNRSYISLQSNGNCDHLPQQYTRNSLATMDGVWQGFDGYYSSRAIYDFSMISFEKTEFEYRALMTDVNNAIKKIGKEALVNDASANLLFWMSWQISTSTYVFRMTGDPAVIFHRHYVVHAISSSYGVCTASVTAKFNKANGLLTASYSMNEYMSIDNCRQSIHPSYLGYDSLYDLDNFHFDYNLYTMITAISVSKYYKIFISLLKG